MFLEHSLIFLEPHEKSLESRLEYSVSSLRVEKIILPHIALSFMETVLELTLENLLSSTLRPCITWSPVPTPGLELVT